MASSTEIELKELAIKIATRNNHTLGYWKNINRIPTLVCVNCNGSLRIYPKEKLEKYRIKGMLVETICFYRRTK